MPRMVPIVPLLGEFARRKRREFGVEWEDQHRIDARRGEQFLALAHLRQPEPVRIGAEKALGVRIEGADDRRASLGMRARHRPADHGLVPQMHSVEIAERDDGPPKRRRNRRAAVEPRHGRAYRGGSRGNQIPPRARGGGARSGTN